MLKIIFMVGFLPLILALKNLCPPGEDILPCYCVSDGWTTRVDCMSVTSAEEIRQALSSMKGIKDVYVDFLRARLDKIPSDLFKGLDVTKISFTNCDLKCIGDEGRSALEGLEDVIEEFSIHFSFSEENELKYLNLSSLRIIEFIEIEGNEMKKLGNEWFKNGPVSLKNIFIAGNLIEEIGDRVFENLVNLKYLWLTDNKFKVVRRSMFPSPAPYLTTLDLTANGITSLPEDMFSNMPSLKEVVLTDNGITKLPEAIWSSVWRQLTHLELDSNPLKCDSHIEWMFRVRRPLIVKGKCVAPSHYENKLLKEVIDESKFVDDDDDDDL